MIQISDYDLIIFKDKNSDPSAEKKFRQVKELLTLNYCFL
jgi:hypothetical protein